MLRRLRRGNLVLTQGTTAVTQAVAADFDTLLAMVVEPAFGMALHLTSNRQDAEDLVQDAALRAFRAFASFTPGTNFKAWFFRILINLFRSSRRTRQHQHTSIDELEDEHPLYLYKHTRDAGWPMDADPATAFLDQLTASEIARALAALPDAFREVATLYFIEDLSYQEIADVLDIPVGTVRSRLHRGRSLLQQRLWRIAEDQGLTRGPRPNPESIG